MKIRDQIYQLLKRRPRTVDELINEIWWVHPQDAPDRSAIKAHIWLLNQSLKNERVVGKVGSNQYQRVETVYRIV